MYKRSISQINLCRLSLMLFGMTSVAFTINAQESAVSVDTVQDAIDNITTDFQKQINANARDQALDGKNKTSLFIDNVVITQGSLEIKADRVEADASEGNGKEVITAIGKPASYRQRLEDGSMVMATANTIRYNVATRVISLEGNAEISQNQSKVSADSIKYDMTKEQILASTDKDSDNGVTTVISPGAFEENKDEPK